MALSMIWAICLQTVALEKEAVLSEERRQVQLVFKVLLDNFSACHRPSREKVAPLSPVNSTAFLYLSGQQSHYLLVI